MITARRGSEVMHFMENDQGHAWAEAYQGGGWDLYTDDGELIPRPVIPLQWAWGAWRPGLPKTPPSKGE